MSVKKLCAKHIKEGSMKRCLRMVITKVDSKNCEKCKCEKAEKTKR